MGGSGNWAIQVVAALVPNAEMVQLKDRLGEQVVVATGRIQPLKEVAAEGLHCTWLGYIPACFVQ